MINGQQPEEPKEVKKNNSIKLEDLHNDKFKGMTSQQVFDTLINDGSSIAKILKNKLDEEGANNSQNVNNVVTNDIKGSTKMEEELKASLASMNSQFNELIALLKRPAALNPVNNQDATANIPIENKPEVPPIVSEPTTADAKNFDSLSERLLALENQNADLLNKIKEISEQPAAMQVSTGVSVDAINTTSNSSEIKLSNKEQEIIALEAQIKACNDKNEKLELSKRKTILQLS
jgi:hypothetical protein